MTPFGCTSPRPTASSSTAPCRRPWRRTAGKSSAPRAATAAPFPSPGPTGALRGRTRAQKLIGDGVDQRLEAGIDDVGRDADREPALARALVAAFHQHAGDGLGAAREDTHLVVDELHVLDVLLIAAEVLAKRLVERVDG